MSYYEPQIETFALAFYRLAHIIYSGNTNFQLFLSKNSVLSPSVTFSIALHHFSAHL